VAPLDAQKQKLIAPTEQLRGFRFYPRRIDQRARSAHRFKIDGELEAKGL